MISSAYVHVPFCASICAYCDFTRWRYRPQLCARWLCRLREEASAKLKEPLKTLYIGGGTPSALDRDQLEQLLEIFDPYRAQLEEYTMEANPESLSAEKIAIIRRHGVNRISLGVQSFDPALLQRMKRGHDAAMVSRCVRDLIEAGIINISADLIYGLPDQDMEKWKADLHQVLQLPFQHLSLYSLTVEEHSLFGVQGVKQASDELEYAMYAYAIDELKKHGFTQYEIANFAKAGARSKHNQVYWRYENFHGIGCGASGKEDWGRYDNTRSLQEYLERGPCAQEIALDAQEQMFEALMMGLRLREGISLQQFEARFHARHGPASGEGLVYRRRISARQRGREVRPERYSRRFSLRPCNPPVFHGIIISLFDWDQAILGLGLGEEGQKIRQEELEHAAEKRKTGHYEGVRPFRRRYGITGGTDRGPHRENQPSDRALQGAQARLSFSERSDEDGRTPQKSAHVPEEERSGALQDADRPSGSA